MNCQLALHSVSDWSQESQDKDRNRSFLPSDFQEHKFLMIMNSLVRIMCECGEKAYFKVNAAYERLTAIHL